LPFLNSTFYALREGLVGDIVVTSVNAEPSLVVDVSVLDDFVLSGTYSPNPKLFKLTLISLHNLAGVM